MRVLIITVAGMSERFSKSLGKKCLKCIYYPNNMKESLLYRMIRQADGIDKYIIVGGFMYDQLEIAIGQNFADCIDKIILVKNEKFQEYGSGYSLYIGLQKALELDFDEIIFAEGDLFVDTNSFQKVIASARDVITCNQDAILADKAVAFYYDERHEIHYIYDTDHHAFQIQGPFFGIFNSGQIWKFVQPDRVKDIYAGIKEEWKGTNLVFIQRYFQGLGQEEYSMIQFEKWINCNTLADFQQIAKIDGKD